MTTESCWKKYSRKEFRACMEYAQGYMSFISRCKTERECVCEVVRMAEAAGYQSLAEAEEKKKPLKPGDRVYSVNYGKDVMLFLIGRRPLGEGMRILGAHIDSPRIDLKPNPLYEDHEQGLLDTQYYGGIKKYQWLTLPLALHGCVARKDGTVLELAVGEKPEDPVFCISDILPHLAQKQMQEKAGDFISGEDMNLLVGNIPVNDPDEKEPVRKYLLQILKKDYGMEEEDFLSAELELVPAGGARSSGFDGSLVAGYGQDDRVCAYSSLAAMLEMKDPERTCACVLTDKEEIGSDGATGMTSRWFENTVARLCCLMGETSDLQVRLCLENSAMLSSDVSAAFDANYPACFEPRNAAFLGHGLAFNKYTGSRGKSGSSDANAEYLGRIRRVLDDAKVSFQLCELGRVDLGGGGTIAKYMAAYNMQVVDSGVPVLSMHAPCEIVSKADVYEAKRGYLAFLKNI